MKETEPPSMIKKYYVSSIFILIFILSLSNTVYTQYNFGLNGGLTFNSLTGDAPVDGSYVRKIGYTAGLHFELHVSSDILLGVGARYYKTGTTVTYDVGEKETVDSFDVNIAYISIPVSFKVLTGGKSTYFTSGLDYKYLLSADLKYLIASKEDKDIKQRMQNNEIAIFAGFGGLISLGRPSIGLELRYSHSLNNVSKDNQSNTSSLPARFRFTGFQLLIFLNYGSK